MLQRIGDVLSGNKWITQIVLGGLSVIFAVWGVYGIATLRFGSANSAAKVNGEPIPEEDVRRVWQLEQAQWQQRVGGEIPPPMKAKLQDEILESFVRDTAIDQHARKVGYRVSDEELNKAVRSEPAFQLDGQYSPAVAKQRLQGAGISVERFEADLRNALRRSELESGIRATDFATRPEMSRLQALQNEEREVRYAVLPVARYMNTVTVDDAAIEAYYKAHQARFMTPESVKLQYAELRTDQLAAQIKLSDADAREYYEKNKDRYVVPERRQAQHILIATSKTRSDAEALKRAQEVLAKAKSGGDFAALAKEYSDDPGSAAQGGDLGMAERSNFVGPFADALFAMSPNEIRGPVKTQYGYHIIRLQGIEPGKTKTFEEARPEIDAQLRHDKAADRFGDLQEQMQQKLEQTGTTLDGLAKEFGMQLGEVADFQKGQGGAPLGNSRELQDVVFSDAVIGEHRIGGPVLLGEDRFVLVRALEHHPTAPKPLAQVRDTIVAALRKERASEAALNAAQQAAQHLKAGASFDEVAGSLDVKAEPARFVGRTDPAVPTAIRQKVFDSPKPGAKQPVVRAFPLEDGGAGLIEVTAVKDGTASAAPPLEAGARRKQAEEFGGEAASAYFEQLRLNAKVEKNPNAFEDQPSQ